MAVLKRALKVAADACLGFHNAIKKAGAARPIVLREILSLRSRLDSALHLISSWRKVTDT